MKISQRMKAIANEIAYDAAADIGTDHAYTPIYAVQTGIIKRAIACDVNDTPIAKAKENVQTAGLSDCIEIRKGYGLTPVNPKEVDTVIISGLGGMLIIDILRRGHRQASSFKQLVLSPQSDVPQVRIFLHSIGFSIVNETMLCEDNKYYHILNCHKGHENPYTNKEYILGRRLLEKKDAAFMQYIKYEYNKLTHVLNRVETVNSAPAQRRANEIRSMLTLYNTVLNST